MTTASAIPAKAADNSDARPESPGEDGLPIPRRYFAVLAIWLALTMAVLDGAIANVALPTIAVDLKTSAAASIWVVNAYQLAITVALLPLAALGDRLGYRRVYMAGLAVFTLGSLACALSHTLSQLTAARVFQGLGGAGIMSINAALLRFTYPKRQLGQGIGLNALVISLAAAAGPTVASAILAAGTWQWLFAINVPLGVVAVVVAWKALPVTVGSQRKFDLVSALLNAVALGLLIMGVESLVREGLSVGLLKLAGGAVAGVLLVLREIKQPAPLVPIDLLRIPIYGLSIVTSIVSFAAQMLAFVVLPFFFQTGLDRSAVATGLLMTPWPLAVGVTAPLAGKLADRYPAGVLGAIGLAILSSGLLALSLLHRGAADWDIVWRMVVCGAGFGFFQSPNNRAMVTAAPLHRSGAAGGMLATARLLGQTSGAVAAAVFFHLAGLKAANAALATASGVAALAAVVSLSRVRLAERPVSPKPA